MIAILSDIHGNLEAFNSVMEEVSKYNIRDLWILGDIIDYGADSVEIIKSLFKLKNEGFNITCLSGNHENYILSDKFEENLIKTSHGRKSAKITRDEIFSDKEILTKLNSIMLKSSSFRVKSVSSDLNILLVHGTVENPVNGIFNKLNNKVGRKQPLGSRKFVIGGHTHLQGFSVEDNIIYINPGSVGQPRNGDSRSQFIIYDGEQFDFIKVSYDIDKASNKIIKSGRPEFLATRLYLGI